MSDSSAPPYRWAAAVAGLVLLGYLVTIAPSVTWWDAGEFIAAARTLGIPHPPGTPLYVLIAHVWGAIVPIGQYALRLNVLSALFSAAGAGGFFLVAWESLRNLESAPSYRWLRPAGAAASAIAGAFTYTQWQNSNETEVYAVAVATIALMGWLGLLWRRKRAEGVGDQQVLLLLLYLAGLSIGCHLLALLAGPALVLFMAVVLREERSDAARSRSDWARLGVVAALWFTLIGVGLGSDMLMAIGAVVLVVALTLAARSGVLRFGLMATVVAAIGVTIYLALWIRAGLHPAINEAQPDNWNSLVAVIRRAQYPTRTPFDNPLFLHGPDNPGRTIGIFGMQLANYAQYFDWQWANGITAGIPIGDGILYLRLAITLLFAWLGWKGFGVQWRLDRGAWCLCTALFLTTGLALLVYMNFKIGNSMGWNAYPQVDQHEVRDRDYFFVVSFVVWGLWAGLGLAGLARELLEDIPRARPFAAAILGVGLLPFLLNFSAATRRHAADARLPGDFAYDLLNSVPPYGILFTYGDNDSFPLWWAQEVDGTRRDVTVVCLALAQTEWYMRQIRDRVPGDFDEAAAPPYWRGRNPVRPQWPVHSMTDQEIQAASRAVMLPDSLPVQLGPVKVVYPARTIFYPNDLVSLRILQQNLGRRPVVWALTAADNLLGLKEHAVQRGLVISAEASVVDSTMPGIDTRQMFGVPLDYVATRVLLRSVYRYAGLLDRKGPLDDASSRGVAANLAMPWTRMASYYDRVGQADSAITALETAGRLSAQPGLEAALAEMRLKRGSPTTTGGAAKP